MFGVEADNWVITEFTGQGTHQGPLEGSGNPIPPTGRQIQMLFCEVLRIRHGRICNGRLYFDLNTLMRQLGLDY